MTDKDKGSTAWKVTPADYNALREKAYTVPAAPVSVYVPMRDGCRLAVDVYLPQPKAGQAPGAGCGAIRMPSRRGNGVGRRGQSSPWMDLRLDGRVILLEPTCIFCSRIARSSWRVACP